MGRASPPIPANKCKGGHQFGGNGSDWVSVPNAKGTYRWVQCGNRYRMYHYDRRTKKWVPDMERMGIACYE